MRNGQLARCSLPLTLLFAAAGCQLFQSTQPVSILARDAETGKPISGAVVRITYPIISAYHIPRVHSA
jgi:hypothetical protein